MNDKVQMNEIVSSLKVIKNMWILVAGSSCATYCYKYLRIVGAALHNVATDKHSRETSEKQGE